MNGAVHRTNTFCNRCNAWSVEIYLSSADGRPVCTLLERCGRIFDHCFLFKRIWDITILQCRGFIPMGGKHKGSVFLTKICFFTEWYQKYYPVFRLWGGQWSGWSFPPFREPSPLSHGLSPEPFSNLGSQEERKRRPSFFIFCVFMCFLVGPTAVGNFFGLSWSRCVRWERIG